MTRCHLDHFPSKAPLHWGLLQISLQWKFCFPVFGWHYLRYRTLPSTDASTVAALRCTELTSVKPVQHFYRTKDNGPRLLCIPEFPYWFGPPARPIAPMPGKLFYYVGRSQNYSTIANLPFANHHTLVLTLSDWSYGGALVRTTILLSSAMRARNPLGLFYRIVHCPPSRSVMVFHISIRENCLTHLVFPQKRMSRTHHCHIFVPIQNTANWTVQSVKKWLE